MPNNTFVDVASINNAISKVDRLWTEASKHKYLITPPNGSLYKTSPLHVNPAFADMIIEAFAIPSTAAWVRKGRTMSIRYGLKHDFKTCPIVTATFDGNLVDVITTVNMANNMDYKGANDVISIHLTLGQTHSSAKLWDQLKSNKFFVHVIAIGH